MYCTAVTHWNKLQHWFRLSERYDVLHYALRNTTHTCMTHTWRERKERDAGYGDALHCCNTLQHSSRFCERYDVIHYTLYIQKHYAHLYYTHQERKEGGRRGAWRQWVWDAVVDVSQNMTRPASQHECVSVCCSVLQCVAARCSVLQCISVWCSAPKTVASGINGINSVAVDEWQCVAVCCSVLQCVAVCCSVLQRCCSVLQCVTVCCSGISSLSVNEW